MNASATMTETVGSASSRWSQLELVLVTKGSRRAAITTGEPVLSIGKSGGGLSAAADQALGRPPAILLLVDPKRGVLVLRPTSADDPNGFSLGPVPRKRGCRISMQHFFQRYGIEHSTTRHIVGHPYEGGLLFELGAPLVPAPQ